MRGRAERAGRRRERRCFSQPSWGGLSVRLLKETFVTRIALSLQKVSAWDTSAVSEIGEGRLLVDTNPAKSTVASPPLPNEGGGVLEAKDEGEMAEEMARDVPSPPPPSLSPSAGFLNVSLVQMSVDSPDFVRERVEARAEATVGELRLFVDVTSAYRLGAFLLFELLPATKKRPPRTRSITSTATATSTQPITIAILTSPSSSAPSSSVPLPRSHQTRLSVGARFEGLLVSVAVGGEAISEVDIRGLTAHWTELLHSADASADLQSITVRDCTPHGRLYSEIVRSSTATAPSSSALLESTESSPSPSPLIALSYRTFSRLDAEPPPHCAAFTGRLRGLHFVFLQRFLDEHLALVLTGPVARLLKEKKARDRRATAASPPPPPPSTVAMELRRPSVSDRRRSSLMLTPAMQRILPSSPSSRIPSDDVDADVSPFSPHRLLLLDVTLDEVGLIVPYHSTSEHFISSSFHSIALSNVAVQEGGLPFIRLNVHFSAFTVHSSLLVGAQRREGRVVELSAMAIQVDSDEETRTLKVAVSPSSVTCALTPSQLHLLLALPNANLKEEGSVARRRLKEQSRALPPLPPQSGESKAPSPPSPLSITPSAAQPPVLSQAEAYPVPSPSSRTPLPSSALTVLVKVTLPTVRLDLFSDEAYEPELVGSLPSVRPVKKRRSAAVSAEEELRQRQLLALNIRGVSASLALHPDGSLQAEAAIEGVQATRRVPRGAKHWRSTSPRTAEAAPHYGGHSVHLPVHLLHPFR